MRIAIIAPAHPYKGGPAQHATSLAHHLEAAGHEVLLQSWSAQYPKLLYPGQLTVDTPEIPLFANTKRTLSWRRPDGWWRIGRRLGRTMDAVILFVYTPIQVPAYWTIARAAKSGGCQMIALCNNLLPHEPHRFDEPLMRVLLRRMDGILVHSQEQGALAADFSDARVFVSRLPPHLPTTAHQQEPSSAARHNRLLFFGIVRRYKGLDILLRALAGGPPEVSLIVAGELWEDREALIKQIAELGLEQRVELREGYVASEDIQSLFASADALVLPYRSATSSQNALIAFDFGVPVIATNTGGLADAVQDGVNGLTCAPNDVGSLTQALQDFYAPGMAEQLRGGVEPVDGEALWDAYVAALEEAAGRAS
jgi:glycosyltransferase involved in cell wall biosynthesis